MSNYNHKQIEEEILSFWKKNKIFDKLRNKNKGKKPWSFIDGPITANNPMGVHHAWGRTYKDVYQRFKAMQGYDQRFQNGFDCQGLWLEVETEKELKFNSREDIENYGLDNFSRVCRKRVEKFSNIQTEQSIRLGQWMDWKNSYFTMSDENIESIWYFLKKNGIDTSGIRTFRDVDTGAYFVTTDMEDNQIGSFYLGAMKYAHTLLLPKANFVVIASNTPLALASYVKQCVAKKMRYLYDPAFQIGELPIDELRDGITHAEIFIGNDYEIALTEKRLNISRAQLLKMVPIVITTLGSKGSRVESHGKTIKIAPAKAKAVIDPTGAGDAYRGGFVAGYLRTFDLQTCGQMGSIAAVYTVEKYGTITHSFTKPAFEKRYKDNQVLSLT